MYTFTDGSMFTLLPSQVLAFAHFANNSLFHLWRGEPDVFFLKNKLKLGLVSPQNMLSLSFSPPHMSLGPESLFSAQNWCLASSYFIGGCVSGCIFWLPKYCQVHVVLLITLAWPFVIGICNLVIFVFYFFLFLNPVSCVKTCSVTLPGQRH